MTSSSPPILNDGMGLAMRVLAFLFLAKLVASRILTTQLPLIVKSPYMHVWAISNDIATSSPSGTWLRFWNGHIIGWTAWIRVDGTSYEWTGGDVPKRANVTATYLTPTRTIFSFQAGPVAFNATYLSPIDPSDLVRQSLPFGYLYIDTWSLDGKPHSVQFYSDITGELLSIDTGDFVQWNASQSGNVLYQTMHLTSPTTMQESRDMTKDGTLFFAMENKSGITWQSGGAVPLRAQFQAGLPLSNIADTDFRAMDDNWPVLGFRADLGNITQSDSPVVWALGVIRDPAVQYTTSGSVQSRSSYYWSAYNTKDDVIHDVVGKFDDVQSKATDLDNRIMAEGGTISSEYQDLISLSLRLVFGGMDITIPRLPNGSLDTSDVKIFMKDTGTSSRVNPVETIYAALPAILYVNASLVGPLLEPLLEYQNSSYYKNAYAAPDLGISYPKIQGNSSDTTMLALENCGNMLIMTLAHAMKTGDGSLLDRYYDLLKGWADYLEKNTLHPVGYMSADGETTPNLSNLALKGIIGLYAMGKISEAAGRSSSDTSHYQAQARNYANQWQSLAMSSDHISSVYGRASTWGLIYNLYASKLLSSDLISDEIYIMQSQFYASKINNAPKFGVPYDAIDSSKAKSHWTMFAAATVNDPSVRDSLIGMIWQRATLTDVTAFPTTYDPDTGTPIDGISSPAQGAMFAPLALRLSNQQITGFSSATFNKTSKVGTIAGSIVGSMVGILVLVGLFLFLWRRHRRQQSISETDMDRTGVLEPFLPHSVRNNNVAMLSRPVLSSNRLNNKGATTRNYVLRPHVKPPITERQSGSPPPRTTGTSSNDNSSNTPEDRTDTDLRIEMERLHREMAALRTQHLQDIEPPPLYEDGGASILHEQRGS